MKCISEEAQWPYFRKVADKLFNKLGIQITGNMKLYEVAEEIEKYLQEPSINESDWISTEDKLPELNGKYLVLKNGEIGTCHWGENEWVSLEDPRKFVHLEPLHFTHWAPFY